MVNKPKIQGTRFETYIVNKAKSLGMWSRRLAEGGSKDEGDLEIIPTNSPPFGKRFVVEAKHRQNLNIHQTMAKAIEKCPDKDTSIVAWKKTVRKNNNKKRSADGVTTVYCMDEETFFNLIGENE